MRVLGSLVLGLAVFFGLLHLLIVVNLLQRLEDPETYRAALAETSAYNRVYDEVLPAVEAEDQTESRFGGVELETQEAIDVLRDVFPPSYLKEQTEANIDRLTGFLSSDLERLELYIDLEEPLQRVEEVVVGKAEETIAELEVEEAGPVAAECTEDSLQDLAADVAGRFAGLSEGRLPESVPSLETLDEECRRQQFDIWIDRVASDPQVDPATAAIIDRERDALRESFIGGDTKAFLETAAAPLVAPVVDSSLDDIREELQVGDRLDLLDQLAENSDDLTREDIDELAEGVRDSWSAVTGTMRTIALVAVIAGSLLLAVMHYPNPAGVLRWPGLSLLLGGGVCFFIGFMLSFAFPGRLRSVISSPNASSEDVPWEVVALAADVAETFARRLTAGIVLDAVLVLVVGAALFGASFFADRLLAAVRGRQSGSAAAGQY